jgi:hypothetical protein
MCLSVSVCVCARDDLPSVDDPLSGSEGRQTAEPNETGQERI